MLVNEDSATSQGESEILHPSSRALFRFWEAARAEAAAPDRRQLDLTPIRHLVPDLAIIERRPGTDRFRWRLAGTRVCDLYRHELTGTDVVAGWDRFESHAVGRFLVSVTGQLQPCLIRYRLITDLDQVIGVEMVGLPLRAIDGRTIHILAGFFPFREVAGLGYGRIASQELSGARSIWTEHLPGDALVRQLAEERRPFRAFQVIPGGRGRL